MQYDEKTVLMGIGFRRQSEFLNSRVILQYDRWQLGGILQTGRREEQHVTWIGRSHSHMEFHSNLLSPEVWKSEHKLDWVEAMILRIGWKFGYLDQK